MLIYADNNTKGKNTSSASISKLKGNLQSWKDTVPLFVSATIACIKAGEKKRSRTELKKLCAKNGIVFSVQEQFEAWRVSLPDEYVKTSNSKESENTDEPLAAEDSFDTEA